jgi:hypothetical protein
MFKMNPIRFGMTIVFGLPLTMVPTGALLAADTGDAPGSYGLASHEVVSGAPQLGMLPAADNDPVNSALADADTPDEDGVFEHPQLVQNGKAYDTTVLLSNPSSSPANLVGWVDFDGNGVFDADEASFVTIPAESGDISINMLWPDLTGLSSDYFGVTYVRFRISTDAIAGNEATGAKSDGEVEDYAFTILADVDGDEIADIDDDDNDNDGIPDVVEQIGLNTDGDSFPDYLDVDSDNDGIPDYVEAGINARQPVDTDNDGVPDYLDTDSNNDYILDSEVVADDDDRDGISNAIEGSGDYDQDGIINSLDIDTDNDTIPDAIEVGADPAVPVDTDSDGIPDYLDLDSDNDGLHDIREGNSAEINIYEIDLDYDGAVDSNQLFGTNGLVDVAEYVADEGVPIYAVPDSDADGVRDFRDTDSDDDGVGDILEIGGTDLDGNLMVDDYNDTDLDGIPDSVDADATGGPDADSDGIEDSADVDSVGGADSDSDGIIDTRDGDANNDGIQDSAASSFLSSGVFPDLDGDTIPDYRDDDSIGNGTDGGTTGNTDGPTTDSNVVIETGLSGSGCSINSASGGINLMFLLMGLVSLLRLVWRRSISS